MAPAPKIKLKTASADADKPSRGAKKGNEEDEYVPDSAGESEDVSMDDAAEVEDAAWKGDDEDLEEDDVEIMDDDLGLTDEEEDQYDDDEEEGTRRRRAPKAAGAAKPRKPRATTAAGSRKPRGPRKPKYLDSTTTSSKGRKRSALSLDADLDEEFESDDEGYVLGAEDGHFEDFTNLDLKPDHANRPLWVCPDGRIFLETFSSVYKQAYDFLIAVAEPVSRPEFIHEYSLTPHSLYAAVSIGLETSTIINVLDRLSKTRMPNAVKSFIKASTENYGKVKLVLQRNKFMVESPYPEVLKILLKDETIKKAREAAALEGTTGNGFIVSHALRDQAAADLAAVEEIDLTMEDVSPEEQEAAAAAALEQAELPTTTAAAPLPAQEVDPDRELHAFEIASSQVEHVKARCLPGRLSYPMLEEYDFRGDTVNPDLDFELKPHVKHRPYQEKSLSKMFGNSRARSGLIVLPCGAGKSLVGVSAAARIKKATLCLCTNSVSVDQWKYQFQLWTTLRDDQVCRFTSDKHEWLPGSTGVCITTYTMVAFSGRRSEESERIMNEIMSREWGLILLDEVHVVPAQMFRRVIGIVKAHTKLGLTATLVREDQLITDLNFLIGPKLYEANWLDLTKQGHIANVQCAEVWCPMTPEFMRQYLKGGTTNTQKQLLYVMNPNKLRACQYLVQYHEGRGDKVIVFSDNIFALREYAMRLRKPFIYGATGHQERTRILHAFKTNPTVNTVFLSKVGDNSLDIPEANVLIQISSHGGSRRQEAQRLGRILRKKRGPLGTGATSTGGAAEEFDAFFYTLVSKDTQEVYFTSKRQQFLIDQGYAYKVLPSLLETAQADEGSLLLSSRDEQLDLLAGILSASEEEAANEEIAVGDDVEKKKKGATKRAVGSMAALSGAVGLKYLEYSTGKAAKSKARAGGAGKLAKFRR